jgi:hypothetical protein
MIQSLWDGPVADDEAASGAPERFAFRQVANVAQAFGHDAQAWAKYRIRLTNHVAFRCPIRDAAAAFKGADIFQSCDRFDPSARPSAISTGQLSPRG